MFTMWKSVLLILVVNFSFGQNLERYKGYVDTLCSPYFFGRGYLKDGHRKASDFLAQEFKNLGYQVKEQVFEFDVNTFPVAEDLLVNDSLVLKLGVDWIPNPASSSIEGIYKVFTLNDETIGDSVYMASFYNNEEPYILANTSEHLPFEDKNYPNAMLELGGSLISNFSQSRVPLAVISVKKDSWKNSYTKIELKLKSELKRVVSRNIIAYSPNFSQKRKYKVVTGHYDHLGGYGNEVYIPGANDNASGVAMMLDLASDFQDRNICFIAFAGEEVGLLGSKYFVEYPLFKLEKIDLVINLDLMGAGSQGLMVENGVELSKTYDLMTIINNEEAFVKEIKKRKNSPNSDHYPFSQKGVDAIFLYSLGKVGGYHNIFDVKEKLEYESYSSLYQLINKFIKTY